MAGLAKCLQVFVGVGAAVVKRHDVMHLGRRNQPPGLFAFLAERVFGDIQIAKFVPVPVEALPKRRIAALVAFFSHHRGVLGAVTAIGGLRAAGVGAATLGFIWHTTTSVRKNIFIHMMIAARLCPDAPGNPALDNRPQAAAGKTAPLDEILLYKLPVSSHKHIGLRPLCNMTATVKRK